MDGNITNNTEKKFKDVKKINVEELNGKKERGLFCNIKD